MKQKLLKITLFVALCLAGTATVLPFLWMVLSSFKTNAEIEALEQAFLPQNRTLENYMNLQDNFDFLQYFANSILIALTVTILVVYTSCICGYVLGKYKFISGHTDMTTLAPCGIFTIYAEKALWYQDMRWETGGAAFTNIHRSHTRR